jgi:hypothetical protein
MMKLPAARAAVTAMVSRGSMRVQGFAEAR